MAVKQITPMSGNVCVNVKPGWKAMFRICNWANVVRSGVDTCGKVCNDSNVM